MIGSARQQEFLKALGFFEPTPVELIEAPGAKPLLPARWAEITTITTSYGHGLSASPMHLAAAYATIANGGTKVTPTLLRRDRPEPGPRVLSEQSARDAVSMLRQVVTRGTASLGEVPGYEVAGKTGTADKPRRGGGYYHDKVINTFASTFPASDPKYVLLVTLDEPVETSGTVPRRTAGWTSVPVAAEIVRRTAPLLGLRPAIEPGTSDAITLARN
jgi:cell division protein FtsI (penicillin-binding protein 3)